MRAWVSDSVGKSYFHWIEPDFPSFDALPALAGLLLLAGWVVFLRARSSGCCS